MTIFFVFDFGSVDERQKEKERAVSVLLYTFG